MISVEGQSFHAFPTPAQLLAAPSLPGVSQVKRERLRAIALAAQDGWLARQGLREMPQDDALAKLQTLPGVGPFFARGILFRGAGMVDTLTEGDEILRTAVAHAYGLSSPVDGPALEQIAQSWRPYRMWAVVLLHVWGRSELGLAAGRGPAARRLRARNGERATTKAEAEMIEPHMHAVRLHGLGDPAQLVYEQVQTPEPGPGEVLVRVIAAAITRDELDWPEDRLPATPSYEFSGVIAATGPGVEQVRVGDEVYALSGFDRDGAAAEYTVVPQSALAPKPRTLDHVHSAAIPLAALSAWQGLFDHGQLQRAQRVMIHGATGGVGAFAVQLAHAHGAQVIATTATASIQAAVELGADEVIDYTTTALRDADPVDLVFDTSGGERLTRSPQVLRAGGRLVSIATEPPKHNGIEAVFFIVEPNHEQLIEIARLADEGVLKPIIDQVFALADARHAFERTLTRQRRGKIVIRVAEEPEPIPGSRTRTRGTGAPLGAAGDSS